MAGAEDGCNEVHLIGRLSTAGAERTMPSGDRLVSFRVTVDRPRPSARRSRSSGESTGETVGALRRVPSVDTLDCVAWGGPTRRAVLSWQSGDLVEVTGSLRRRFWRGPAGAASRTEVDVTRARRLRRTGSATC